MSPTLLQQILDLSNGNQTVIIALTKVLVMMDKQGSQFGFSPQQFTADIFNWIEELGYSDKEIENLYRQVCKEDVTNFVACISAAKGGIISKIMLDYAVSHEGEGVNISQVHAKIAQIA